MSRKQKTIQELLEEALVPEDEQPYEIPGNWVWVNSEYVANWGSGGTPSRKHPEYFGGNIPWIKTGDLNDTVIEAVDENITEEGFKKSSAKIFPKGSVAIAMYGATIGKLGILQFDAATNQACAVAVPLKNTTTSFLYYYFKQQRKNLINMGKGGAQPNISQTIIKKYPFVLPPIEEQKRIVAIVERLLNKIDEAKQLIDEAKETFELRRAAILDKAFSGKLTAKWREDNPSLISTDKLVENINITQSNMKKKEISHQEVIDPPYDLPKGWIWVSLEMVSEKITDGTHHSPKSFAEGDYKYITAKNIKEDGILLDNTTYVTEEVHREIYNRCDVKKGDVLYIKDGATTGIATVNNLEEEFSLLSSVGVIRTFQNVLLPEFLKSCLNSPRTKERMLGMMSGNAIRRLTLKKIKQGIIPLPSIEEQKVIIEILKKMDELDQKIKICTESGTIINNLEYSILNQAFRGELGTNDPTEQSALELLQEVIQVQVQVQ